MAAIRAATPVDLGGSVSLSIAGAESNVAIGLARLGHDVAWAGIVGDDRFGNLVLRTLRAEGIDISRAGRSRHQTGLILFEDRLAGVTSVDYYRAGSAGSMLDEQHVISAMDHSPRILHLTGITAALGPAPIRAMAAAARATRTAGGLVSLDVNYRSRLWSRQAAREAIAPLAMQADILIASDDELDLATESPDALLANGVRDVVIKHGADGATVKTATETTTLPARPVEAVDAIGAGDAFVAGYLSGELDGLGPADRLARGVALGAFAVATHGDWEGLPRREELPMLGHSAGSAVR